MNDLMITRRPNRKPTHPGEVLCEDVLPAMHASVTGFAKSTGMSRQSIHAILSGRRAISPEAALRIGAVVGNVGWRCRWSLICGRPSGCCMMSCQLSHPNHGSMGARMALRSCK